MVPTKFGPMSEDRLKGWFGVFDSADARVETTEYCLIECTGDAHKGSEPLGDGCYCPHHVHRSVAVTVKRYPEGECSGVLAQL
jgi:hypothetical protein